MITENSEITPMKKYPFMVGANDPRVLTGFTPVTIKSQAQAMSANGHQFAASAKIDPLAANGSAGDEISFAFQTPSLTPVTISKIDIVGQYVDCTFDIFKDGTFTGGSPIPVFNNNDLSSGVAESVFTGGVTVATPGNQTSPTEFLIGAVDVGNRTQVTSAAAMGDKIFAPGSTYIGTIKNLDTVATGPMAIRFYFNEAPVIINGN